jgi:hypothetical protein
MGEGFSLVVGGGKKTANLVHAGIDQMGCVIKYIARFKISFNFHLSASIWFSSLPEIVSGIKPFL